MDLLQFFQICKSCFSYFCFNYLFDITFYMHFIIRILSLVMEAFKIKKEQKLGICQTGVWSSGSDVPITLFVPLKPFSILKISYKAPKVLRGAGGQLRFGKFPKFCSFLFFEGFPNYLKIFLVSFILEKQMLHILTETLITRSINANLLQQLNFGQTYYFKKCWIKQR